MPGTEQAAMMPVYVMVHHDELPEGTVFEQLIKSREVTWSVVNALTREPLIVLKPGLRTAEIARAWMGLRLQPDGTRRADAFLIGVIHGYRWGVVE